MRLLCVMLCRRYERLLVLVHSIKGASLLVGGPGTAKTTVINQFMSKFNSEVGIVKQQHKFWLQLHPPVQM